MKKITLTFLIIFVFFTKFSIASEVPSIYFEETDAQVSIEEEFIVNLNIETNESLINGVNMNIEVSDNLELEEVLDNRSIVPLWINSLGDILDNELELSGIIPGGFSGVIDPTQSTEISNNVVSIVIKPIKAGRGYIRITEPQVTLHDGSGTVIKMKEVSIQIYVSNEVKKVSLLVDDKIPPEEFIPILIKDPSLFDNEYALFFTTKDFQSGIARYEVREDDGLYKRAVSPYRLEGGTSVDIIYVRAIDRAGNDRTIALETNFPSESVVSKNIVLTVSIFGLVLILILVRRRKL